jgi:hypothetical protein
MTVMHVPPDIIDWTVDWHVLTGYRVVPVNALGILLFFVFGGTVTGISDGQCR